MKRNKDEKTTDRRDFLKLIGAGAVSGGTALGAGAAVAGPIEQTSKTSGQYRETKHVKTYYELAKF